MRYGSVCSGIEAATSAWHPLGWTPAFFSEVAAFPAAVLAHHYPEVPNLGDMTKFEEWLDHAIDLLAGGTPCQDVSIGQSAGTGRGGDGLDGTRSGLAFSFVGILRRYRPRWFVWENVPNILSKRLASGFLRFIRRIGELGYCCVWRVLDAAGFGLSDQPRPRIFVVGYLGDVRPAAAVLFERESNIRDLKKKTETAPVLTARGGMAFDDRTPCILDGGRARIATPAEWEQAIGFPADHTRIAWRGKSLDQCPDGPRYRAVGNSMDVNVMRWIGKRIALVDGLTAAWRIAA